MPILDTTINTYIDAELIRANAERSSKHTPSGKLSASMLYQPIRFQLLKNLGATRKEFDAYTLAKFKRGVDVEEWYVTQLRGAGVLIEDKEIIESLNLTIEDKEGAQPYAVYRDCVGYVDSIIDTNKMQAKKGIMPNEIKSVTNMKFKRIKKMGIDWHYKIQAALYALAMGSKWFAVTIVSAEDYRSITQIFDTASMKHDVDVAISAYMKAMDLYSMDRRLPKFEANEHVKWTGNIKYAMFPEEYVTKPDSWVLDQLDKKGK